jgi:hypothetical protein
MTWPDQSRYEGFFKQGKMEGQGSKYYANGNILEGAWAKDLANGPGRFFKATDGTYKEGNWTAGKLDDHWQVNGQQVRGTTAKQLESGQKYSDVVGKRKSM